MVKRIELTFVPDFFRALFPMYSPARGCDAARRDGDGESGSHVNIGACISIRRRGCRVHEIFTFRDEDTATE